MRKIGIVFVVVFVASWMFSLFCMHAAGQAGEGERGEPSFVETGASGDTEFGKVLLGEAAENGNGQSASGRVAGWSLDGTGQGTGDAAGWTGNAHSADQGDGEIVTDANAPDQQVNQGETDSAAKARSRRIILERYGVRTYLSVEDYLPGVMVCQTGPEMGLEALKCQAVIARTYIYRQMGEREEIQEEELDLDYLGDYGVQDGNALTVRQKEQLAKRLEQCRQAAEATSGVGMKYEDRYILPLFHERSAGRTRTGEADYPYLQSVESKWDVIGNDAEASFRMSEFAERIGRLSDAPSLDPDRLSSEIQVVKRDDAGYVLQIKIGPRTYTGDDVQYALELPSTCFAMDLKTADRITVSTKGRGHGYGLSQNGAQAMAEEGWSYSDILNYYYKNIVLVTE